MDSYAMVVAPAALSLENITIGFLPSQTGRGQSFNGFGLREGPSPKEFSKPEKDGGISVGFLKDEIFRGGSNVHRV
jgi:hypothetical protein